jgi:hypothetical protein
LIYAGAQEFGAGYLIVLITLKGEELDALVTFVP